MFCPKCKVDLEGDLIYDTFFETYCNEKRALETAELYGATKTEGRWGRQIGIISPDCDSVLTWRCPDCHYEWSRFK